MHSTPDYIRNAVSIDERLAELVASEGVMFREARLTAIRAADLAAARGLGRREQMSAAIHAALAVLDTPEPCVRLHSPSPDREVCSTHATVFSQGGRCPWDGVISVAQQHEAEMEELRARATTAEAALAELRAEHPEMQVEYVPGCLTKDGRPFVQSGVIVPDYVATYLSEGGSVLRRLVGTYEVVTEESAP